MAKVNKYNLNDYCDVPVYIKDFLIYLETINGFSPNTVKAYYYDIKMYLKFLTSKNNPLTDFDELVVTDFDIKALGEVSLTTLYEYMAYVNRTRSNSASARSRKVSSLRTLYKYLHSKMNLIDNDPTINLDSPKI